MTLSERIETLLNYSGRNISEFSRIVGFKTPQTVRELIKGNTKTLSDSAKHKLLSAFPELNEEWLLTGKGEMLVSDVTPGTTEESFTILATNSPGAGLMNDVKGISAQDLKAILEVMNSQQKEILLEIKKRDELIDRLLSLLEKKND